MIVDAMAIRSLQQCCQELHQRDLFNRTAVADDSDFYGTSRISHKGDILHFTASRGQERRNGEESISSPDCIDGRACENRDMLYAGSVIERVTSMGAPGHNES